MRRKSLTLWSKNHTPRKTEIHQSLIVSQSEMGHVGVFRSFSVLTCSAERLWLKREMIFLSNLSWFSVEYNYWSRCLSPQIFRYKYYWASRGQNFFLPRESFKKLISLIEFTNNCSSTLSKLSGPVLSAQQLPRSLVQVFPKQLLL